MQVGQPAAALPYFKNALAIEPGHGQYTLSYADALLALGRAEEALGTLKTAIKHGNPILGAVELKHRIENFIRHSSTKNIEIPAAESKKLVDLYKTDEYTTLESVAKQLIDQYPTAGFCWKVLGAALLAQGKDAVYAMQKATILLPSDADAHFNLGNALRETHQYESALTSYHRSLEIKADFIEAHCNLGLTLHALELYNEAIQHYRQAIKIKPNCVDVHCNLGNAYRSLGHIEDAFESYRLTIKLQPSHAVAHFNLGNLLQTLGQFNEAIESYRRTIEINPNYVDAHFNLGCTQQTLGQLDEAIASFRHATEMRPNFAEAFYNQGLAFQALEQYDNALNCYRQTLEIKPDYAGAYVNSGVILSSVGKQPFAIESYRLALEINPNLVEAHNNLGAVFQAAGQLDDAIACHRKALEIKPDFMDAHSSLIFALDFSTNREIAELQLERKKWNQSYAAHLCLNPTHDNEATPSRSLKIGYISADLKEHSASLCFGGMLTQYDRSQFDVYAYSNLKGKEDKFTELFKKNVTAWRNIVNLSDEKVVELIRTDKIDILVDLSGHTLGNRLLVFARKPAPIQITAWGYATGTGLTAIDYFFTDPVMVPPQDKIHFTEEVRYLPCALSSFFSEPFPEVNELPALSNGIITFGSFNRLAKVSKEAFRAWANVLLAVPLSRMILKTSELNNDATRDRVLEHFTSAGIDANRIIMQGSTPWHEHMQAYNQIDITLDSFPHGGGVTTLEGLKMGVPVVTLRWPSMAGRASAAILTPLNLCDWIAETQDEYVEIAIKKASDLQALSDLRKQLRGIFSSSIIGDSAAYARAVEKEYRHLWQKWCDSN